MEEEPRTTLHPLTRVGGFLLLFVVLQVVVGIPAMMIWTVLTRTAPATLAEGGLPVAAMLFVFVCLAPVMIPATVVVLRKVDGRSVGSIGARWPAGGVRGVLDEAGAGTAGAVALLAAWLVVAAFPAEIGLDGLSDGFRSGPSWLPGTGGGILVTVLFFAGFLIQSGLEEWVFRGYVYRALRERWSWPTVAGASSLGFAVLHYGNPSASLGGLVNTFLLGVAFAALVEATGTLWTAIAAHGVWNFVLASVLGLPLSGTRIEGVLALSIDGPEWATGGSYGPEGSWLLTALLVPVVGALAVWVDSRTAGQPDEGTGSSDGPGSSGEER